MTTEYVVFLPRYGTFTVTVHCGRITNIITPLSRWKRRNWETFWTWYHDKYPDQFVSHNKNNLPAQERMVLK